MVIEHVFITTLDGQLAMERARQFLVRHRFYLVSEGLPDGRSRLGAASMPEKLRLELRRGEQKASAAKSVADLPQHVSVEFDRGRVTLAAEIIPSPTWGRAGLLAPDGQLLRMKLHRELLHAIAKGLEQTLTQNLSLEAAVVAWNDVEQSITQAAADRRRFNWILIAALILVIMFIFSLIFWSTRT